jgi:hypothetical protein
MSAMSGHFDRVPGQYQSTALIFGNENERFFVPAYSMNNQ